MIMIRWIMRFISLFSKHMLLVYRCISIAAEGTVKNRMRGIFKILDVSDRIGFMATYGGYEIKK